MLDVSLQLLCTSKSGTLSRLIREIHLCGLQYKNHKIDTYGGHSHITINATGDFNCTLESFEALFDEFPEVLQVQHLKVTQDGKHVDQVETRVSQTHISALEHITPALVMAAEKRLADILGPVASFIVETAAQNCNNAGQLYGRLAEELYDQEQRDYFLSIIENN